MSKPSKLDIFTRCHTVLPLKPASGNTGDAVEVPKHPPYILAFDSETTENLELSLEFGAYQYGPLTPDGYVIEEEGLIFADNLDERSLSVLREYSDTHKLRLRSRGNFVEKMVWPTLRAGGALVAFNLGFDLSRIAVRWSDRKDGKGFTFYLSDYWSEKRKRLEVNRFRPGIARTSIDSKKSFYSIGFTEGTPEEINEYRRGRFLDVRTLAFALTNRSHSLESLCKTLGAPAELCKSEYIPGPLSPAKIDYCRRDVTATVWALNVLRKEFNVHNDLSLHPDRAYSPVSLAKSYLRDMGLVYPVRKFDVSPSILGSAMEAFYAGRTECKIRRTKIPVVYCDLFSAYPTCNALQKNWDILTAESISIEDCAQEASELMEEVARDPLKLLLDKSTWPRLRFFAPIKPDGDILPLRAKYDDQSQNIGFNHAYGSDSIYYAGFDLATSVLLTGKVPIIESAFKLVPHGKQAGLEEQIRIRGEVPVNPIEDDFYQFVTEERAKVKKTNEPLAEFLKCVGNGGAFGLFAQIDPHLEPKKVIVEVFSGAADPFPSATVNTERGGSWYFPILASWVTSGAHLLLGIVERLVIEAGGVWALMDTDSAAIVATEHGGLVPCPGGKNHMPDGREAVYALSWEEVRTKVVEPLRALNPYRGEAGNESVLKIEKENLNPDGTQRQLFAYSISSKRYCMFIDDENGGREIVKASAHGLGFLYPPFEDKERKHKEHQWIWDAWEYILALELEGPDEARDKRKPYFDLPAMMQIAITTPALLARFKGQNGFRPLNFMLAVQLMGEISNGSQAKLCLVTPFTKDRSAWKTAIFRDIATGDQYTLYDEDAPSSPNQIDAMCYGGIIEQHRFHPEPKFCGPGGQSCGRNTRGLLERRHVQIGRKIPIRKESNRRWEGGNDPSILQGYDLEQPDSIATEYIRTEDNRSHTTHALASSQIRDWLGRIPLDLVSHHTGIDRHTLRSVRDGNPARREVLLALTELKKLWINAEQCGALKSAHDALRRSRRDYKNGGALRDLMLRERK